MRMFLLFSIILFIISEDVFSQIPIKKITKNVLNFDTAFSNYAKANGYAKGLNRWYVVADINNDKKNDLVLQSYYYKNNQGGSVNIFLNTSTDSTISFSNKGNLNFFLRGHGIAMDVGDVNNDGRLDILAPTVNFHGTDKPIEFYPTGSDHTPDRLFVQTNSGFQEFVQPDTLNTISGSLIDIDGDGKDEFISSNNSDPVDLPGQKDNKNLLFRYIPKNDTLERTFILELDFRNNVVYKINIGGIDKKLKDSFYIPLIKFSRNSDSLSIKYRPNDYLPDSMFILKYRKGQLKYYTNINVDTVGVIPYNRLLFNNTIFWYAVGTDYSIYFDDIDGDGITKTIVQQYNTYNDSRKWLTGDPLISRFKIYDKKGKDITDNYIPKDFQYDPQNYFSTQGFSLYDINGDGLKDIIPYSSYGWVDNWKDKYLLLNTGKSYTPFKVNVSNLSELSLIENCNYPIRLRNSIESALYYQNDSNANVMEMDFSQFKFPCSKFPPSYNLSGKTYLCEQNESILLKIDSVAGYKTQWYVNDQLKSASNNIIINDSARVKLKITNLGGCSVEREFNVVRNSIPNAPSLIRDNENNLVASTKGITWYKDGVKISDTTQKIKPTSNGIYTATTTQNGCTSSISQGYYYLTNAVYNLSNGEYFKISPNPTSGEFSINYKLQSSKNIYISVFDINGRLMVSNRKVESGEKINLRTISKGNIIILVKNASGRLITSQRLVKN